MTRQSPKKFFFDIETGGFSGSSNPILSISWAVDQGEVQSAYSDPTPGSTISRWSENKVWQSIKKKGYSRTGEKEALLKFLNVLEGAPADTQLIGWNIGHSPFGQKTTKAGGFDIPFLITRAKEFGLERRYQKVLRKINIHDEGALWAYRIAKSVSKHGNRMVREGSLHKDLYTEAIGFMKQAGKIAGEQGLRGEKEIARELSLAGISFAGWKQESTFKLLFANDPKALELLKTAHESETDVIIQRMIMGKSSADLDEGFVKRWGRETLENKIVSSLKTIKAGGIERYSLAMAEAKKWGIAEGVEKKLRQTAMESGIPFSTVQAGGGIPVKSRIVRGKAVSEMAEKAGARGLAGALDLATPFLRGNWGKIAIGAGAATLLAVKPGAMFSGRDDAYNVIEGLPHGGQAERMRRTLTDFGSGYRGLKIGLGIGAIGLAGYSAYSHLSREDANEEGQTLRRFTKKKFSQIANKLWDIKPSKNLSKEIEEGTSESAKEFRIFSKALKKYGEEVGTGHKRILIPKNILSIEDIEEDLGFVKTNVAIPEAGQTRWATWRHPDMKYHMHEHGEVFTMHLDRHEASTMAIKKMKRDRGSVSLKDRADVTWEGLPHVTTEGIPGAFYYLKGRLLGSDPMLERIKEEVDPEYNKLLLGIKAAQRGMSFSGKDDFYNTIEGLPHGGMAEKKRKELTDFGSGYQGQDTSNALAYGGIAAGGALGGYLTMFPWKVRGIDIEEYPRLAKMQKAGFKHGMKIVSSSMAASIGGEEYKRKSKSAKMIGRLLFEELDPTRSVSEIRNFQGVAYIHSAGRIAGNRPSNPIMANWGNWGIGVDKLSTWKYLQERGGTEKHAETIAADEFYSGRGRKASLSDAGKRFIDEAGGVDKLVVKHRLSSLGEGVWTNAAKMPQDVAEKMLRNPNEFLLQKRIDLAAEFRVITVGDKAVYSAHRFGTPGAQKLGKLLDKLPNIPGIGKIRWNENIQPVLNKDVNKKLAAFAESAARDLPYEIGAFDIGMTKSGGFKVIEAQRSFGSITNPIVSRRIRNIITGKAGKAGVVAAVTGAGLALMGANIILGKDDAYNTIEGLRHGGLAGQTRAENTGFGSGWIRRLLGMGGAFSQKQIRGFAKAAREMNVEDFAKHMGVKFQDVDALGGAVNVGPKWMMKAEDAATQVGIKGILKANRLKHGQAYVSPGLSDIKEQLPGVAQTVDTGVNISSDAFMKTVIFHEAAELGISKSVKNSKKFFKALKKRQMPQHSMVLPQEELFLREFGQGREFFKGWRKLTDPTFSGFDDAYNTIEGLRHDGLAQWMRKILTDFGSGWLGNFLSKGAKFLRGTKDTGSLLMRGMAPKEARAAIQGGLFARGKTLGAANTIQGLYGTSTREALRVASNNPAFARPGLQLITAQRGQRFLVQPGQFAKGGAGGVEMGVSLKSGRKVVYKTAVPGKVDALWEAAKKEGTYLIGGGFSQLRQKLRDVDALSHDVLAEIGVRGIPKNPSEIDSLVRSFRKVKEIQGKAEKASKGWIKGYNIFRQQVKESGATAIEHEVKMQKLAHKAMPRSTTAVLGTTDKGFFQEWGGRALLPEERAAAAAWAGPKFKQMAGSSKGVIQLDPHLGQIVVHPQEGFKMIDFGFAVKASKETQKYMQGSTSIIDFTMALGKMGHTKSFPFPNLSAAAEGFESVVGQARRAFKEVPEQIKAFMQKGPPPLPKKAVHKPIVLNLSPDLQKPMAMPGKIENLSGKDLEVINSSMVQELKGNITDFGSPVNLAKAANRAEHMYKSPPVASKLKSSILEPGSQKARRRQRMQQSHKKAQVSHSVNSLRPGKRHRQQAGRLVN